MSKWGQFSHSVAIGNAKSCSIFRLAENSWLELHIWFPRCYRSYFEFPGQYAEKWAIMTDNLATRFRNLWEYTFPHQWGARFIMQDVWLTVFTWLVWFYIWYLWIQDLYNWYGWDVQKIQPCIKINRALQSQVCLCISKHYIVFRCFQDRTW